MNTPQKTKRRWLTRVILIVAALALLGFGGSSVLFSTWTTVETLSAERADDRFDEALAAIGDATPYVQIRPDGSVLVDRAAEAPAASPLKKLHMLTWSPSDERQIRVDFPFWFVKLKMTDSFNLGTLAAFISDDWDNISIKVTENDLERRGPALILDHQLDDGRRLVMWTSD